MLQNVKSLKQYVAVDKTTGNFLLVGTEFINTMKNGQQMGIYYAKNKNELKDKIKAATGIYKKDIVLVSLN